jgi:predicted CoA-binding protein
VTRIKYLSKYMPTMALVTDPIMVRRIAQQAEVVAMVGISKKPERASHQIAEQIQHQYSMHYVNPVYAGQQIFGEVIVTSLKDIPQHIDIVDVFRNPRYVNDIIEEAMAVGAGVVWLQPGSESTNIIEAYQDDIDIIAHACLGVVAKQPL